VLRSPAVTRPEIGECLCRILAVRDTPICKARWGAAPDQRYSKPAPRDCGYRLPRSRFLVEVASGVGLGYRRNKTAGVGLSASPTGRAETGQRRSATPTIARGLKPPIPTVGESDVRASAVRAKFKIEFIADRDLVLQKQCRRLRRAGPGSATGGLRD